MTETAFGAALMRAGFDPSADTLAAFTNNLLHELHLDKLQASRRLVHELGKRDDWYTQAIESVKNNDDLKRMVGLLYVEARLRDMRGAMDGGQKSGASNGQSISASTNGFAQTFITNRDGAGHSLVADDGQVTYAHPVRETNDGDEGQPRPASNGQETSALTPSALLEQQREKRRRDFKIVHNEKTKLRLSALDTVKMQDGAAFGDLFVASLGRRKKRNQFEAKLFELTEAYLGGRVPPNAVIRDHVSPEKADEFAKQAYLAVEASYVA